MGLVELEQTPHMLRDISGQEPVKLGLLLNPKARFNRRRDVRTGATRLLGAGRVVETSGLAELPGALHHLFHEQGVNVLGICGGDGTMHHAINALLRTASPTDPSVVGDATFSIPPILALRGGTLNMLTRALRSTYDPLQVIETFQARYLRTKVGALRLKRLRCVRVEAGGELQRYGFIFGSELTARCLALYDETFGGGYRALATFLRTVLMAFLTQNALWQRHRYLFEGDAPHATIHEASTTTEVSSLSYRALVAATIDIELLGGWIVGLRASEGAMGSMRVRVLKEQPARQIMTNLHTLMFGRDAPGILDVEAAREVSLECSEYSLDGEVFQVPGSEGMLTLRVPQWTLPFVAV